jgi:hypothetical protein
MGSSARPWPLAAAAAACATHIEPLPSNDGDPVCLAPRLARPTLLLLLLLLPAPLLLRLKRTAGPC